MNQIDPYVRIVCEGDKTEPNYFIGYLLALGIRQPQMAYKPKNHSPKGVAREAKAKYKEALRSKIPREKIFVAAVFDRNGHTGVSEAIEMLREVPITIAFSNVCFEFWILLHFQRTSRPFQNCDEVMEFIRRTHDPDYGKANDHYMRLKELIPTAISNAEWLANTHWAQDNRPIWEKNPFTSVYILMQKLQALKG